MIRLFSVIAKTDNEFMCTRRPTDSIYDNVQIKDSGAVSKVPPKLTQRESILSSRANCLSLANLGTEFMPQCPSERNNFGIPIPLPRCDIGRSSVESSDGIGNERKFCEWKSYGGNLLLI